ncbi:DUF3592 domain-containing protein [Streptomyces griseoviridis]
MATVTGGLLCAGTALFLLLCALIEVLHTRRLTRSGVRTEGTVIANVPLRVDDGPTRIPVIAFVDQQGRRVEFRPRMRGRGMGLPTGATVPVVHPPGRPRQARVLTRRHLAGPAVALTLGAAAFLGVAAVIVAG